MNSHIQHPLKQTEKLRIPVHPSTLLVPLKTLGYSRSVQFSSVTQSCLTLCDPMNRSTPGPPVTSNKPSTSILACSLIRFVKVWQANLRNCSSIQINIWQQANFTEKPKQIIKRLELYLTKRRKTSTLKCMSDADKVNFWINGRRFVVGMFGEFNIANLSVISKVAYRVNVFSSPKSPKSCTN